MGIGAKSKRYEDKGHKLVSDGKLTINGEPGTYILTGWKDGPNESEKHTAQYLKDGRQYMVVFWGPKGKIDKAVKRFALGKE